MKPEKLVWDSSFFGLNIAKVEIEDNYERLSELSENDAGYDLYYIFSPKPFEMEGVKLVDVKRVYSKEIEKPKCAWPPEIQLVPQNCRISDLYALAYESGWQSRFKNDDRFPEGSFEKLYSIWVDKSISGELADAVFVSGNADSINGFVTVRQTGEQGNIGLIATSRDSRGKGIGGKLLLASELFLSCKGVKTLSVATQKTNVPACSFYEKMGYRLSSEIMIYHFWA